MKLPIALVSILLLLPASATAGPSKKECKGYATMIEQLADQLKISKDVKGRDLLGKVTAWSESNDSSVIRVVVEQMTEAVEGIDACEKAGMFSQVTKVKGLTMTMKSAVLPWLSQSASIDPCQDLISQAVGDKEADLDGTIDDLTRAVSECKDPTWIREAQRQLADAFFLRGDASRNDYVSARRYLRDALSSIDDLDDEQQTTVRAILARSMIAAGKDLMDGRMYGEAVPHWREYIEIFGTPRFDVLFDVSQIAQGTGELRGMRDARFQLATACLEAGDGDCVQSLFTEHPEMDSIQDLTERSFEMAEASGRGPAGYGLAFDLLTAWHRTDPGAYGIKRILQERLVSAPADQRLALLRSVDECWVPTEVAALLRNDRQSFVAEAEIAAACGGTDERAATMLAELELARAREMLDSVVLARSATDRRQVTAELEQLLNKIGPSPETDEIRASLAEEQRRISMQTQRVRENKAEVYADCTTLLATIQWNDARDKDFDREMRDFRTGCCTFLKQNLGGWRAHMSGLLDPAEVENKERLMQKYCGR